MLLISSTVSLSCQSDAYPEAAVLGEQRCEPCPAQTFYPVVNGSAQVSRHTYTHGASLRIPWKGRLYPKQLTYESRSFRRFAGMLRIQRREGHR
jgi:hypothetical protein